MKTILTKSLKHCLAAFLVSFVFLPLMANPPKGDKPIYTPVPTKPASPGVITTTSEVFDKISVAAWNVTTPKGSWGHNWQASVIMLEQVLIKLKNGKIIAGVYESVSALQPGFAYDGAGVEKTYKLNQTINRKDIESVGLTGTGTLMGYQVFGRYGGVTAPLYYRPVPSHFGTPIYYLTTDPNKITWLPNTARVNSFIKRDATISWTLASPVPANQWLCTEIELTDGDFLLFRKKGPLSAGVVNMEVPAPYALKPEQVVGARVYNADVVVEYRNREMDAPMRPVLKYMFNSNRITVSNFRVDYREKEGETTRSAILFTQSSQIAAGSPAGDIAAIWEVQLRKRQINADWKTSEILVQFITGNDDLRVNTKFSQHASKMDGDILVDTRNLEGLPPGAVLQSNIALLPNPLINKLPFDGVGDWFRSRPDINISQKAYEGSTRDQEPFLVWYQAATGIPDFWYSLYPFNRGCLASVVIPTNDLRVASMGELRPRPRLGRGASTIEHFNGAFALDNDNWQLAGVIVSAWTEGGWRRIYSKFKDIPFYYRYGQDFNSFNINLREQYEAIKYNVTPVKYTPSNFSKP